VNLRQLQHFLALTDEGSFARAAEKVHLSQPALSRSIQALEADLDLQLFERQPRGVVLTPAGKQLQERSRRLVLEANALDRDVALIKNHELGEVSFGFGPHPATILMADMMAVLSTRHPLLKLRTEVSDLYRLQHKLLAEELDFFVVEKRALEPAPEWQIRLLSSHRCGWFSRPEHPLFQHESPSLAELRQQRLATVPLSSAMQHGLRSLLQCQPSEMLEFQVECNSLHILKQLACRSDTVLYAARASVSEELQQGKLRELELADLPGFSMQFALVHLAQRSLAPSAEQAIAALLDCDSRLQDKNA
jgi:DNA-binding transcriptional LysR family regulator